MDFAAERIQEDIRLMESMLTSSGIQYEAFKSTAEDEEQRLRELEERFQDLAFLLRHHRIIGRDCAK